MIIGQFEIAYTYARMIHENVPPAVLQYPVLAKYFEAFVSIDIHVLIRFGKWDEILRYPEPPADVLHCLLNQSHIF